MAEKTGEKKLTYLPVSLDLVLRFYAKSMFKKNLQVVNYWLDANKFMVVYELMEKE